jgi:mRNA interferase HicA
MNYRDVTRKLKALSCEELPSRGGGSDRKRFNPDTQKARGHKDYGMPEQQCNDKVGQRWSDEA